jgi:hypothetical protein
MFYVKEKRRKRKKDKKLEGERFYHMDKKNSTPKTVGRFKKKISILYRE